MELSRYEVMDAYTLEELRRKYQAANVLGRIELLAIFPKADDKDWCPAVSLPPELVRMAAEDDSVTVRQWIARNGCFGNDSLGAIEDRLVNDPDLFVRACIMENQTHISYGKAKQAFLFATHLERLALMRNPQVVEVDELIWKIFDLKDEYKDPKDVLGCLADLGIDFDQRKELALAFISNPAARNDSLRDVSTESDGMTWFLTRRRWATVWKLAAKWPKESGVPYAVFRSFTTDDEVKAEVYQQSTESGLRCNILASCRGDQHKTIKLGITDSFKECRYIAYSKIWWPVDLSQGCLEAVLTGNDEDALRGLAENKSLPVEVLERITSKFEQIGDYDSAGLVISKIKRIRQKQPSPTDQLPHE
jgi:hypothetical protein